MSRTAVGILIAGQAGQSDQPVGEATYYSNCTAARAAGDAPVGSG